jgi:hypothetical protein
LYGENLVLYAADYDGTAQVGHGGYGSPTTLVDSNSNVRVDLFGYDKYAPDNPFEEGLPDVCGGWTYEEYLPPDGLWTFGDAGVRASRPHSTAQIGHGGYESALMIQGEPATVTVNATRSINLAATETSATGQIGHGGYGSQLEISDTYAHISTTSSDLALVASGDESTVQIGHGGHGDGGVDSYIHLAGCANVTVNVNNDRGDGNAELGAGDEGATAQIGHGGRFADGYLGCCYTNITLNAEGYVHLDAKSSESTAQVGHGGNNAKLDLNGYSDINVSAGEELRLRATAADTTALVGHGGHTFQGYLEPYFAVINASYGSLATDDSGANAVAQVGHGGYNADFTRVYEPPCPPPEVPGEPSEPEFNYDPFNAFVTSETTGDQYPEWYNLGSSTGGGSAFYGDFGHAPGVNITVDTSAHVYTGEPEDLDEEGGPIRVAEQPSGEGTVER